jgi:ComF family protein
MAGWRDAGLDLLFPPCCAYCGVCLTPGVRPVPLCPCCRAKLAVGPGPFCRRCGSLLRHATAEADDCVHCRARLWHLDGVLALGPYESDLRAAVLRMKHFHQQPLAAAMGQLLAARWADCRPAVLGDVIVPMPIHWIRRISRGTSSPEVMAELVAAQRQVTLARGLLRTVRATRKQSLLPPGQRLLNVQGAFRVTSGRPVRGLHVVLIDDVVTTGATANEAARVLRSAGAASVTLLAVARALPDS